MIFSQFLSILLSHSSPNTPLALHNYSKFLVSTNIYFISLTFPLGPDEVATVWWLQKLVCNYCYLLCFSNQAVHIILDKNKGSNIFKYLKDKYGEETVRLLRNWENIIKKMASRPNGGASVPSLILPGHSSPNTSFPYTTTAPFLVSTNIYFISLTFL